MNLDLSNAWVVALVECLPGEDRGSYWPAVFTNKGLLRVGYTNKGQSSKNYDPQAKVFKYTLLFGEWNMIESEGRNSGLPSRRSEPKTSARTIELGLIAQVQDTVYNVDAVEAAAKEARGQTKKVKEEKVPKPGSKSAPTKRRTRANPGSAGNEDEESDEDMEQQPKKKSRTKLNTRADDTMLMPMILYILFVSLPSISPYCTVVYCPVEVVPQKAAQHNPIPQDAVVSQESSMRMLYTRLRKGLRKTMSKTRFCFTLSDPSRRHGGDRPTATIIYSVPVCC